MTCTLAFTSTPTVPGATSPLLGITASPPSSETLTESSLILQEGSKHVCVKETPGPTDPCVPQDSRFPEALMCVLLMLCIQQELQLCVLAEGLNDPQWTP